MNVVIQLLLCLSTVFCFVSATWCTNRTSSTRTFHCLDGNGGEMCGKDVCLSNDYVECADDICVCPVKGHGNLFCGEEDEEVCYVISDPTLTPFTGESVTVAVSCKFQLTMVETWLKDRIGKIAKNAQCTIEALSWGEKGRGEGSKGKVFASGIEAKITVLINGTYIYHNTFIYGGGYREKYRFAETGSRGPNGAGTYGKAITTDLGGNFGTIYTNYNETDNIAEIRADCCGFRLGLRPAERVLRQSKFIPGVYVKVKKDLVKEYLGKETGLCLEPNGSTFKEYIKKLEKESGKTVSRDVAILYRVLKSGIAQNFPGAPNQLGPLAEMASECDTKPLVCAITDCAFIMSTPKFLKCWSKLETNNGGRRKRSAELITEEDTDEMYEARFKRDTNTEEDDEDEESSEQMNKVVLLMHQCMSSYCGKSSILCETVKSAINKTECVDHIKAPSIMDFNCTVWDEE